MLLAAGADLHNADMSHNTPLKIAEKKGHTELVTILKDHAKTREPLAEDSGDRIAPEPEPELVAGTTETEIKRVNEENWRRSSSEAVKFLEL